METALKAMFGVQCPGVFDGSTASIYQGFEDGTFSTATSEVPAFCGRYSNKNSRGLFPTPGKAATKVNFNFNKYVSFTLLLALLCF